MSEAAQGRGSDIEDGLNPVLHSSGRPEFIRVRIIPPQDQRKRILNKSSCWGENAIVRGKKTRVLRALHTDLHFLVFGNSPPTIEVKICDGSRPLAPAPPSPPAAP